MRKIFLSFSARLTFYILTLTCFIFACIAVVFSSYSRHREEKQAVEYTAALQQTVILKIDNELAEVETALQLAAGQVEDFAHIPDSMSGISRHIVENKNLLKGVGVAFRPNYYPSKGRLFFDYIYRENDNRLTERLLLDSDSADYTKRKWFQRAMRSKSGFWTDPYIDYDNKTDFMTSYVLPCFDSHGRIYAVLLADVSLTDLTVDLNEVRTYEKSYSFIITNKGQYVAHPDKKLILKSTIFEHAQNIGNHDLAAVGNKMTSAESGTLEMDLDGNHDLLCYAPMKRTGWSVCSVIPYVAVMHELGSATFSIIVILVIGLALLSICIQLLVRYISQPIKDLTDASYIIAKGNFAAPLPNVETKDDIRKLHDAFAHMQQSLSRYIHEVETTTRAKERIQSELAIARNIQMGLVPKKFSPFEECADLELFASLLPAKEVGGDFYDFFIRDGKLIFAIGDVSGKGVPAALVMAITRTLFRVISKTEDSPAKIVGQLNNAVTENNDTNMFITMYAGCLDLDTGELIFCNAGHNAPLIIGNNGDVRSQQVECNLPLGVVPYFDYVNQTAILPKGSAMLLYTDGLTEAENANKELFGDERTMVAAKECAGQKAEDIIKGITDRLASFVGKAEQSDDLTMMCFRVNGNVKEQTTMKKLVINNKLEESAKLVPFIDAVAAELKMSQAVKSSLNLAIEEAVVNVIQYAYPPETTKQISLTAKWTDDKKHVEFTLKDCGRAFDPLQAEIPDLDLSIEDRPIGGLGILLVRDIMDSVAYQRLNGENILKMGKNL